MSSRDKMMYVYDCFDHIIELIESDIAYDIVLSKLRDFRDELPTSKEVSLEFINNCEDYP